MSILTPELRKKLDEDNAKTLNMTYEEYIEYKAKKREETKLLAVQQEEKERIEQEAKKQDIEQAASIYGDRTRNKKLAVKILKNLDMKYGIDLNPIKHPEKCKKCLGEGKVFNSEIGDRIVCEECGGVSFDKQMGDIVTENSRRLKIRIQKEKEYRDLLRTELLKKKLKGTEKGPTKKELDVIESDYINLDTLEDLKNKHFETKLGRKYNIPDSFVKMELPFDTRLFKDSEGERTRSYVKSKFISKGVKITDMSIDKYVKELSLLVDNIYSKGLSLTSNLIITAPDELQTHEFVYTLMKAYLRDNKSVAPFIEVDYLKDLRALEDEYLGGFKGYFFKEEEKLGAIAARLRSDFNEVLGKSEITTEALINIANCMLYSTSISKMVNTRATYTTFLESALTIIHIKRQQTIAQQRVELYNLILKRSTKGLPTIIIADSPVSTLLPRTNIYFDSIADRITDTKGGLKYLRRISAFDEPSIEALI